MHICEVCSKTFQKKFNLVQHQRVHSGERPFVCEHPNCGKSFAQAGNLAQHANSHKFQHLRWIRNNTEKPHHCPFPGCPKSFISKSALTTHKKNKHKQPLELVRQQEQSPLPPPAPMQPIHGVDTMTWMRMTNTSSQVPQPQGYFMNPAMYLMLPQPFPAPRTNTQSPQNGEFGPTELRHGISSASCGMMQQHPPFYYQRPIGWPAHHSVYNYNPSTPWSYRKAEDQEQRTQSTNGSNDVIPIQQGRVDPHGSGDTVPLFTEHSSILPSFNTSLPAPRNLPKHQIHGFSFSPHHRVEEEHTYDSGTTISEHQVDRSKASSANDARDILIDDMSQFSNNSSHASAKSSSSSRKVEECSLPLPPFSSPMYRHPSWTPQNLSSSRFSAETQRPMESHPYESDQTQHHMTNVGYLQDRYSYPPFPQSSSTSSTTSTSSSLQDKYENYFAQQEMQHQRQPQQHDLNVSPDNYDQIHFGSHHRDHNQDEIVPSLKKRIKIENVDKTTKEKEKTNSAGQGH